MQMNSDGLKRVEINPNIFIWIWMNKDGFRLVKMGWDWRPMYHLNGFAIYWDGFGFIYSRLILKKKEKIENFRGIFMTLKRV